MLRMMEVRMQQVRSTRSFARSLARATLASPLLASPRPVPPVTPAVKVANLGSEPRRSKFNSHPAATFPCLPQTFEAG